MIGAGMRSEVGAGRRVIRRVDGGVGGGIDRVLKSDLDEKPASSILQTARNEL